MLWIQLSKLYFWQWKIGRESWNHITKVAFWISIKSFNICFDVVPIFLDSSCFSEKPNCVNLRRRSPSNTFLVGFWTALLWQLICRNDLGFNPATCCSEFTIVFWSMNNRRYIFSDTGMKHPIAPSRVAIIVKWLFAYSMFRASVAGSEFAVAVLHMVAMFAPIFISARRSSLAP